MRKILVNIHNIVDLEITLMLSGTLSRLGLYNLNNVEVEDLETQYEIIKYRSYEAINSTYGGKYESNRQWKKKSGRTEGDV